MKLPFRALAALLAALGLSLTLGATPSYASSVHGCPDGYVCLYQWLDYGAPSGDANPGWKSTLTNLYYAPNSCINLTAPMAYWPNGTAVTDNSASFVVNDSGWGSGWHVDVFDWVNCNYSGGLASSNDFHLGDTLWPDLREIGIASGLYAYHRITSLRLTYTG